MVLGSSLAGPQKAEYRIAAWPSGLTGRHALQRAQGRDAGARAPVFPAGLSTIQASARERTNRTRAPSVESYSALERNEVLTPATTWMDSRDVIQRGRT